MTAAGSAGPVELSVVLCDDKEMQKLNQEWRGNPNPTDVLSFEMGTSGFAIVCFPPHIYMCFRFLTYPVLFVGTAKGRGLAEEENDCALSTVGSPHPKGDREVTTRADRVPVPDNLRPLLTAPSSHPRQPMP